MPLGYFTNPSRWVVYIKHHPPKPRTDRKGVRGNYQSKGNGWSWKVTASPFQPHTLLFTYLQTLISSYEICRCADRSDPTFPLFASPFAILWIPFNSSLFLFTVLFSFFSPLFLLSFLSDARIRARKPLVRALPFWPCSQGFEAHLNDIVLGGKILKWREVKLNRRN